MKQSHAIFRVAKLEFRGRSRILCRELPPLPICRKARGGLFI